MDNIPLGKEISYISHYQPDLLFPIPRQLNRDEIGVSGVLPFKGQDIWTAFEISWLNAKGKPMVAIGDFIFPCESPNLIESKSFKLYLNSFNNTKFDSLDVVEATIRKDLSAAVKADVVVNIVLVDSFSGRELGAFAGESLDHLDIECNTYLVTPKFLKVDGVIVTETLTSDLLKSNCLVTGQPDWASVQIEYTGQKIQREGLLKYLVSFRDHNEFHEQCVERIFVDIMKYCAPQKLTVYARYTRRGGLDINPYRSTEVIKVPQNVRLSRQ
jgi:7-cyano-7-deazaguanine reductase